MEGKISLIRFCKVVSVDDNTDAGRIKVRLTPEDNDKKNNDELDYAFPLIPKMFHVRPKEGEAVLVLLAVTNDGNSQRYYIGPVISQSHRIFKDPFFMGGDSFLRGSYKKFDPSIAMDPSANGIVPRNDDICILGRKNCDIQITEDDIRIKAGVKISNESDKYKMAFNEKNPSYIKLKYHKDALKDNSKSTATIVGDKINLLSTSSPNYFELTNREELITDETIEKVINEAYKLPYGEKLVNFLKVFVNAFVNHTHNYPMLPPNEYHTIPLKTEAKYMLDNEQMLSNSIRIN